MSDPDLEPERASSAALGADLIIPVLACGLVVYYFASTVDLVWEAKATGLFIGAVLVAFCIAQFVRLGLRIAAGEGSFDLGELTSDNVFNRQRLALVVLAALFVTTLHWVGTTLGLFLLLICAMWVLGVRSLRALIGVAFATAAVVHLVLIYLLNSRLPQGAIERLLGAVWGGA
jgi:hypothetical protein